MPEYRVHLLGGLIVGILGIVTAWYYHLLPLFTILLLLPIGLFYSLLPDVDIETSKIWHIINTSLIVGAIISMTYNYKFGVYTCLALMLVIMHMHHRGIMHKYITGIILSLPFIMENYIYSIVAFAAYSTHLLLDNKK